MPNPLGEFVHSDEQMRHAAARRLEWAHHVQPLDGKGPGKGDGLECRSRQVLLGAEDLAPFTTRKTPTNGAPSMAINGASVVHH